jgi:phosphatidylserine/phosphatidylglycerophosphate/cardiolipin synthase-like enzyme
MKKRKKQFWQLIQVFLQDGVVDQMERIELENWLMELDPPPDVDDLMSLKRVLVDEFTKSLKKNQLKLSAEQAVHAIDRIIDILYRAGIYASRLGRSETEKCGHQETLEVHFKELWGKISQLLESAVTSIDIAAFTLSYDPLRDLLKQKAARGVAIRIITEDSSLALTGSDVVELSKCRNISVKIDGPDRMLHHKFIVIDQKSCINGSMNFTNKGMHHNSENIMVARQPEIVNLFAEEFLRLWGQGTTLEAV